MILRFQGENGYKQLLECVLRQKLVLGSEKLAQSICEAGNLSSYLSGEVIIEQGSSDQTIYFIISGSLEVQVNGRKIAQRFAGEQVGEMALVDPGLKRSATVRARETSVVLGVSQEKFIEISRAFPEVWKRLAETLSHRLNERGKFHLNPNKRPEVFIASSLEAFDIAEKIKSSIVCDEIGIETWKGEDIFALSSTTIESLLKSVDRHDFGIIILSEDDVTKSRKTKSETPRDNVIFELGLFMGGIGRERTFILRTNKELKVPSDLNGITVNIANFKDDVEIAAAAAKFKAQILKLGPK